LEKLDANEEIEDPELARLRDDHRKFFFTTVCCLLLALAILSTAFIVNFRNRVTDNEFQILFLAGVAFILIGFYMLFLTRETKKGMEILEGKR